MISNTDVEYPELHDFLMSELQRLGKDPARTTSEVVKGDSDRVFDLKPALIDPDGAGGDPPTGVSLKWTEVLPGDYDQNGLVTIAEITALGQNLGKSVSYDAPALHGGFAYWPSGDPDDDGGETPPAAGSPAANWRLARIDGNRDGLLTINDITPIAQNWQEALSGYRIYRQAPGESQFTMLPGKAGTNDFLSVTHPTEPGLAPVRYSFADDSAATSGVYLYYVAPYDLQSQAQGPSSGIVSIDLDTGTVNSSPVANLSVTPDFAGAPAEITLDASASYDPDGSIAAYEWDFDGDGTVDWLSTDPLPETSSDGTVDSFEVVEPGKIRATYRQGSAEYYSPSVKVTDDLALQSGLATAQLGISGWEVEILNDSLEDYKITVNPGLIEVNPVSGKTVLVASRHMVEFYGDQNVGLFYLEETDSGPWQMEEINVPFLTGNQFSDVLSLQGIYWDENNQPLILFHDAKSSAVRIWYAQRAASGQWKTEQIFVSSIEGATSENSITDFAFYESGMAIGRVLEFLTDKPDMNGSSYHIREHIIYYDHGNWETEYTGFDTAETKNQMSLMQAKNPTDFRAYFRVIGELTGGPWGAIWTQEDGFTDYLRIDDGSVSLGSPFSYCREAIYGKQGERITLWEDASTEDEQFYLLVNSDSSFKSYHLNELNPGLELPFAGAVHVYVNHRGIGVFSGYSGKLDGLTYTRFRHLLLENNSWLVESPIEPIFNDFRYPGQSDLALDNNDEPIGLHRELSTKDVTDFSAIYFTSRRVDPRD